MRSLFFELNKNCSRSKLSLRKQFHKGNLKKSTPICCLNSSLRCSIPPCWPLQKIIPEMILKTFMSDSNLIRRKWLALFC